MKNIGEFMLEQDMDLKCNGNILATKVFIPEGIREEQRGGYKFKFNEQNAMMWMFTAEGMKLFDMMWMWNKIGYIALDKNKKVVKVGHMHPWISYRAVKCMYFIEVAPNKTKNVNVGDTFSWQLINS